MKKTFAILLLAFFVLTCCKRKVVYNKVDTDCLTSNISALYHYKQPVLDSVKSIVRQFSINEMGSVNENQLDNEIKRMVFISYDEFKNKKISISNEVIDDYYFPDLFKGKVKMSYMHPNPSSVVFVNKFLTMTICNEEKNDSIEIDFLPCIKELFKTAGHAHIEMDDDVNINRPFFTNSFAIEKYECLLDLSFYCQGNRQSIVDTVTVFAYSSHFIECCHPDALKSKDSVNLNIGNPE
jgi:hypothetical protein